MEELAAKPLRSSQHLRAVDPIAVHRLEERPLQVAQRHALAGKPLRSSQRLRGARVAVRQQVKRIRTAALQFRRLLGIYKGTGSAV